MKDNQDLELDDNQEYEEWQYDMSTDLAMSFVREDLLPALLQFDYNHSNDDYIPGVATYIAFTHIVQDLIEQGFTVAELSKVAQECADAASHRIIH